MEKVYDILGKGARAGLPGARGVAGLLRRTVPTRRMEPAPWTAGRPPLDGGTPAQDGIIREPTLCIALPFALSVALPIGLPITVIPPFPPPCQGMEGAGGAAMLACLHVTNVCLV